MAKLCLCSALHRCGGGGFRGTEFERKRYKTYNCQPNCEAMQLVDNNSNYLCIAGEQSSKCPTFRFESEGFCHEGCEMVVKVALLQLKFNFHNILFCLQEAALKQRRLENIEMRPKPPAAGTVPGETWDDKEIDFKRNDFEEYIEDEDDFQVT